MGMPPNSNSEGNQICIIARFLVNTADIPFSTSRDAINRKAWSTIGIQVILNLDRYIPRKYRTWT